MSTQHLFIRPEAVVKALGISKEKLYAGIRDRSIPAPFRLGARFTFWPDFEVEAYIEGVCSGKSPATVTAEILADRQERQEQVERQRAEVRVPLYTGARS